MKQLLAGICLLFATAVYGQELVTQVINPAPYVEAYVPGEVLAAPHPGKKDDFDKVFKGKSTKKLGSLDVYIVKVPPGQEKKLVADLKGHPHVQFIELNMIVRPATNDPYYAGYDWHMPKIGLPTAWLTSTGTGVIVAVLDSGVQANHPDLVGNLVPGWNFYNNTANTNDVCGHGTSTIGTVVAVTNNGRGAASVAYGAKGMMLKISDDACNANWGTVGQAISYAADHGARVVSWSWSGPSVYGQTILNAASYLRSKGGVMFAAAGNGGALDNTTPTTLITTVASTGKTDVRSTWSTYGPFVDIAAPGESIVTTRIGSSYCLCSGTSFATPVVAGVAALMIAAKPTITPAQIDSILYSTALDRGTVGKDIYYGWGRVNAAAAVAAAKALP